MIYDRPHTGAVSFSEQTPPVLPPHAATIPGSISVEQDCGRGVSQASGMPLHSQISNEISSGTSGVPDAPSALHSGQGSSIPNLLMPLTTLQLSVEDPEGTHNEDTNQASNENFFGGGGSGNRPHDRRDTYCFTWKKLSFYSTSRRVWG